MGDELTNAALIGLIGMFGIALVLRAAGSVTAFLTGLPQPDAGPAAGLLALIAPSGGEPNECTTLLQQMQQGKVPKTVK